ncbi:MAG: CRISPR-associated endonuclease Cas1 [Nitrososphaeria archaeon]|nr:CRISPR-associated endonuclease Cas1 [Nitrososphaeria archaeon]
MPLKLILTGYGYRISKKNGLLTISKPDGSKKEFSIGNLSMVLANIKGLSISGDALRLMIKHGVPLILVSRDRPVGKIQPLMLKTNIRLKKEQFKAQNSELGIKIAKNIILNKILNQVRVLKRLVRTKYSTRQDIVLKVDEKIQEITSVYRKISEEEVYSKSWLISKEAESAKHYWEAIANILPREIEFNGRRKKYENPEDPLNISLNYLYTLLMYQVWYAVELSGLDPFIGYLHEDSSRRPSLVMDLMEEFRQPVVDLPLINYFIKHKDVEALDSEKKLTDSFRKELLQLFFNTLEKNVTFMNRSAPIKTHIRLQPIRLAKYILGFSNSYRCYDVVV